MILSFPNTIPSLSSLPSGKAELQLPYSDKVKLIACSLNLIAFLIKQYIILYVLILILSGSADRDKLQVSYNLGFKKITLIEHKLLISSSTITTAHAQGWGP